MSAQAPDFLTTRAEGSAFPVLVKLMATFMVLALVYWGAVALVQAGPQSLSTGSSLLVGGAFAITLVAYVWILKSQTSIDGVAIEQTWLWKRRVALADITQAKFIYVPWLSWLLAPRLIVRAGPGVRVFYCADPKVIRAFSALMTGTRPGSGGSD